ncbi:MAG: methionyl-tRNA formyltransferase [Candidatus Omnitrophota bacterium]
MRTIYFGHNPGYVSKCHEETDLAAVFWHNSTGNMAERAKEMLEYCNQKKIIAIHHFRLDSIIHDIVSSLAPDLIVIGEYHFLFKKNIIDIPRFGAINMHGAPLPRYRGAHPINWMIINGETEGAVTCHYITEGLDNGDIIAQYPFPILETESAYDVRPKIESVGQRLLADVLRRFKTEGKINGIPQDEKKALYVPPRKPEDGLINWNQSPKDIYNFVRALSKPYPGAFAWLGDKKIFIWRLKVPGEEADQSAIPGAVMSKGDAEFRVAVKKGTVDVIDWEIEGRDIQINDRLTGKHVC